MIEEAYQMACKHAHGDGELKFVHNYSIRPRNRRYYIFRTKNKTGISKTTGKETRYFILVLTLDYFLVTAYPCDKNEYM